VKSPRDRSVPKQWFDVQLLPRSNFKIFFESEALRSMTHPEGWRSMSAHQRYGTQPPLFRSGGGSVKVAVGQTSCAGATKLRQSGRRSIGALKGYSGSPEDQPAVPWLVPPTPILLDAGGGVVNKPSPATRQAERQSCGKAKRDPLLEEPVTTRHRSSSPVSQEANSSRQAHSAACGK